MHEATRSKVLDDILQPRQDEKTPFGKERQHTAQAFTLHVEWKDGRHTEGFAWAHYTGYQWLDDSASEKLVLIFGPRALEIEGHNLGVLVEEIREGKLNRVRETSSSKSILLKHSGEPDEPIISAIHSYPKIEEILKEIKGEDDDDKGRHARRLQR